MGGDIPLKMHPTAPPGRAQNLGHRRLDALVRVRDHQLHAAQAATCQLAQEFGPDRLGLGCPYFHAQNLTRPSEFTPMAMMAATDTIRPPRLTYR